ncbi:hypothetical protein BGI41_07330 [Methanobrevibacter sp. 87.7]|uniref:class III signal peptide-containing protein n=1 Tax=Methanobrevibacter sp. 87.7 TaxID=387957 RepID=UPI000B510286|nr:class III signal peptide-containing protein [Methanobrevibacter sp. 87.7]OWT32502.1 hypothetical protein BGI41_07330 [Methanobrevibacter sp. 87.7]
MNLIQSNRGQLSIEYLFIFIISLTLITIIFIPLISTSLDYTIDVTHVYNTKAELSEVVKGINEVYASGSGSKRVIFLTIPEDCIISFSYNKVSTSLKLSDNTIKNIELNTECNNLNNPQIKLSKGFNKIIIEWPDNTSNIRIYIH